MKNRERETIQLSYVIPESATNGPGSHYTIWAQGCTFNCPGCFNPQTHDPKGGYTQSIEKLVEDIKTRWKEKKIRGVTFTGGEPLQQAQAVLNLAKKIKNIGKLGIIVLTGYEREEIHKQPELAELNQYVDVFITGRFRQHQKIQRGLKGSSNKDYIFNSTFYTEDEFDHIPEVEIITKDNGSLIISGIHPEVIEDALEKK
ncbi:MAG: 4Fe-4S single cluster domain-containing protein [Candidatus Hodarchaeota archaeon]